MASQFGHLAVVQLLPRDMLMSASVKRCELSLCIVYVSCAGYDHVQYSVCGCPLVVMVCFVQSLKEIDLGMCSNTLLLNVNHNVELHVCY